ncbi:unnamed protein product [Soboliphyme baturini]|uniref:SWIRM-assoc_2 domain-containing protein n=1 Tax=Soboliphyme baturini TaxID=241478 RepID=A0A183J567_9BILA|nr:unnamed protein product [Soboliphyme baturini]
MKWSAEDDVLIGKSDEGDHGWVPNPVDVSKINLNPEMQLMVDRFAQHFHDLWASSKFSKNWKYGETYSRVTLTHPRLRVFNSLKEFEKKFYRDRCAECIKTLLAWGYHFELTNAEEQRDLPSPKRSTSSSSVKAVYNPQPLELSNITLSKEMTTLAEAIAEDAHLIWAAGAIENLSSQSKCS